VTAGGGVDEEEGYRRKGLRVGSEGMNPLG